MPPSPFQASNFTLTVPSYEGHDRETATSIFWALVSLALTAVVQPSFCACIFNEDVEAPAFAPHRSSPFVCLIDAFADIRVLLCQGKGDDHSAETQYFRGTGPSVIVMRAIIFIVGVVPPAVKVFSTQGAHVEQAMAAVFLLSALSSLARTLMTMTSYPNTDMQESAPSSTEDVPYRPYRERVQTLALLPHVALLCQAWSRIGFLIDMDCSETTRDATVWVAFGLNVIWFTYAAQHAASVLVRGCWTLPRMPQIMLIGMLSTGSLIYGVAMPPTNRKNKIGSFHWTVVLLCHASIGCLAVSWLLLFGVEYVKKKRFGKRSPPEGETRAEDASMPTTRPVEQSNYDKDADATGDLGLASIHGRTTTSKSVYGAAESSSPGQPPSSAGPSPAPEDDAKASTAASAGSFMVFKIFNGTAQRTSSEQEASSPLPLPVLIVVDTFFLVVWRLMLSFSTLYGFSWTWTLDHLRKNENYDTVWLAFGILNIFTAGVYYWTVFPNHVSSSPEWAENLG